MLKIHYWPHHKVWVPTIIRSQGEYWHLSVSPTLLPQLVLRTQARRKEKGISLPYTLSVLFALLLAFFFLPGSVLAKTIGQGTRDAINFAPTAAGGPTFSVYPGFNTRYRSGSWIPVQVMLQNEGADFTGTVSITTNSAQNSFGSSGSPSGYQVPITLANGAQKQVMMYVPIYTSAQSITVSLLDSSGATVRQQNSILQPLNPGDIFVGILSDSSTGFGPLSGFALPNPGSTLITDNLTAATLPDNAEALQNFDLIVLDNFTTSTLSANQLASLQTWVNSGGALIVAGGPEWQRTLSALPPGLLPVTVSGTTTLPAGTRLLPIGSPSAQASNGSVQAPVTISTASTTATGNTILASGSTPLIVQADFGQGTICYVAFDPILAPVVGWTGASALWKGLLLRTLGDGVLANSYTAAGGQPGQPGPFTNLLQSLLPNSIPSPWILALLLIGYVLILGPVRMVIVRWRKRRDWSWRIILSSVVVFSLATYGLALEQKGTSVVSNRITILQLSQDGSVAHVTSYLGIFVPNQGDYAVHFAGNGLVQISPDEYYSYSGSGISNSNQNSPTTITPGQGGTDVHLQGVNIWTLRSLVSQKDAHVQGGIISHLTLNNGTLTGKVTNTLSMALSDVYVLMPNSYVNIGDLGAGATKQVNLSLNTSPSNPGTLLASQIAMDNGMPGYYFDSSQIHTERQRHIAIMAALDGIYNGYSCAGGGPCAMTVVKRGMILAPGGGGVYFSGNPFSSPSATTDPLLIAGVPATLIGWANPQQASNINNDITINGASTSGIDETMIQAPLHVNFSGMLNLPPTLLNGEVVDVEGNNVQSLAPGIYSLSAGNMTFEFVLPDAGHIQSGNLTMTEPANVTQVANPGGAPVNDGSQSAMLYNWRAHAWDTIAFQVQTFTTGNTGAYIGPGGRVLVQFGNTNTSSSTTVFGKPSLTLEGVVGK